MLGSTREQTTTFHAVDAREFEPWLGSAVSVYAAAMNAPKRQIGGRRPIIDRHLGYPGFRAYLALRRNSLVGFCYGFHGQQGQWWHDAVVNGLRRQGDEAAIETWLDNCFEVAELQVHPKRQGQGIGRTLITTLCAPQVEDTVVLSTHDLASPARSLYRSLGFVDLLTRFRFPAGAEDFAVMGAPLPLPDGDSPATPAG